MWQVNRTAKRCQCQLLSVKNKGAAGVLPVDTKDFSRSMTCQRSRMTMATSHPFRYSASSGKRIEYWAIGR